MASADILDMCGFFDFNPSIWDEVFLTKGMAVARHNPLETL
jgi:hypothetical protein